MNPARRVLNAYTGWATPAREAGIRRFWKLLAVQIGGVLIGNIGNEVAYVALHFHADTNTVTLVSWLAGATVGGLHQGLTPVRDVPALPPPQIGG